MDVPLDRLLSPEYAAARRELIRPDQAWPGAPPPGDPFTLRGPQQTEHDTSYVCVVDAAGNASSATPSDGGIGGAAVPGLGFPISGRGGQNWLDPAHPSCLAPWKRPRLTHALPYTRVSGKEQQQKGLSLPKQVADTQRYDQPVSAAPEPPDGGREEIVLGVAP